MKVDMVVMRHSSPGAAHFLSRYINANIVNAGDGTHEHPTQALLDAYSIREQIQEIKGKKVAIIGDILHSRVALSNIYALKKTRGRSDGLWPRYPLTEICGRFRSKNKLGCERSIRMV